MTALYIAAITLGAVLIGAPILAAYEVWLLNRRLHRAIERERARYLR